MWLLVPALLSCGGESTDSGAPEEVELAPCDPANDRSTGEVEGSIDCAGGICEIPAGSFWMGNSDPAYPDECPARKVELSAYAIDQVEVTRGAWEECVASGACEPLPVGCESAAEVEDPARLPASCMTWSEAGAYCAFRGGRLPTEAEWEKAARGLEGARFPWGDLAPTCNDANHRFVSSYCELGPVEVGSYPDNPSAFGLFDMAGNVWEWVADGYDALYYPDAPDEDPPGPETCVEAPGEPRGECRTRVIRGGAWNTNQDVLRGSERAFATPETRDENIGLRCAYDR